MRVIIILLLFAFIANPCFTQTTPKKEVKKNLPDQVPSKSGMQAQTEKPMGKVLPDYDEMNCRYKTDLTLSVPGKKIFSINVECNKMTTEFDLKFIKGSLEENLATGKYKGRVEIEQKIGSDDWKLGPVKMGTAKLSAGAGVEFNEGGIQDVYLTGNASLKASGVTMSSANARVSVITGNSSITGGGALSGIRL